MVPLPVANILDHKLRSALSALGVGIGVCMLITLAGLSRGSLGEIADRWDSVDADLIVSPLHMGDNLATARGDALSAGDARAAAAIKVAGEPAIERVVPVLISRFNIGRQQHNVVGVAPEQLPFLLGPGGDLEGRSFDPDGAFAAWLTAKLTTPSDEVVDVSAEELAARGGLEMVIDSRLARAEGLDVGSKVSAAGHEFTVVGIVPAGAMVRAFMPLATAQFLFGGGLGRSTLLFVKLRPGVRIGAAAEAVRSTKRLSAMPVGEFRGMLASRIGSTLFVYVDAVNAVTLIVSFLFILVILYTMVIQRTREIAILRSLGATRRYILRCVLCESLILTAWGAGMGMLLSLPAGAAIEALAPFLTVKITYQWVLLAAGVAAGGGIVAGLYPAWCATRVDVAEALALE